MEILYPLRACFRHEPSGRLMKLETEFILKKFDAVKKGSGL